MDKMLGLIDLEEEEDQEDLAATLKKCDFGLLQLQKLAINNLRVVSVRPAFYQSLILGLVRTTSWNPRNLTPIALPPTKLYPGEPVAFYSTTDNWVTGAPLASGTVRDITDTHVFVEIHDGEQLPTTGLTITKTSVAATYEIYRKALKEFVDPHQAIPYMSKVLLDMAAPRPGHAIHRAEMLNLNDSQKEAILRALGEQDLAIIKGPPGTGKTRVLAEYIRQVRVIVDRVGSLGEKEVCGLCAFEYGRRQPGENASGLPPRAQAMPNRQQGQNGPRCVRGNRLKEVD